MSRNGLTVTMIFLAESANYGESIGNIVSLKKMTRGDFQQYSYISRQALRYSLVHQLNWNNTPVDEKSGVVQFAPSATIEEYPEIDLFGYMKTTSKDDDKKGGASTRSAVARLSNAIALEPYQSDLEFLTNMGLAKRNNCENNIAQSEIHRSYYSYTMCIDLERVGIDGDLEIEQEEKAKRVKVLLDGLHYLYRDIKGRRENLSPLFIIGGRYERKNPFFENRVKIEKNKLKAEILSELLEDDEEIEKNTFVGMVSETFDNDAEIRKRLQIETIGEVFNHLKEEVDMYYGESN
jgi:CRISPR-associated protein Cst2